MNMQSLNINRVASSSPRVQLRSQATKARSTIRVSRARAQFRVKAVLASPAPAERAPGSLLGDDLPYLQPGEATWGPEAPQYVAEWRRNLDLKAWGQEMRELERELKAQQGEEDVSHLKGVLFWSNVCYFSGLALAGVCNPMAGNPIAAFLISTAIFCRWTMVGHHSSHGGYNSQQVEEGGEFGRFHRKAFAKGPLRRVVDWLDWMLPEAWDVEHNNLHHYKLGEVGDPDLVERNLQDIRKQNIPKPLKYVQVAALMLMWKWFYYAPNTLKEMNLWERERAEKNPKRYEMKEQIFNVKPGHSASIVTTVIELFKGNARPIVAMTKVLAPFAFFHYVLCPLPFYLLGGPQLGAIALANMVLADIITNIHSFIVIATNHCGRDVYRFDTTVVPKSDEFYLRAVIGSANFRTAHTTPLRPEGKPSGVLGNINDFMHGWLNYQIEHHMFPDMSMLSYQKAMPRVKEACERHGVPYVQESVWIRLKRTTSIMVGSENMLQWERGM